MDVLKSKLLTQFEWLDHGFGTRARPTSQDGMASLKQIHSAIVLIAEQSDRLVGEGDALVTATPGVTVSIRTADCFPILIADSRNRAVAAVHAGWRGTAAEIAVATLAKMRENFGTAPADVWAAIGPGIGKCCYEVGIEVGRQFGLDGAGKIDLAQANREQLIRAGVPSGQIEVLGLCTQCHPDRFYSYRRDKTTGRMISFIGAN